LKVRQAGQGGAADSDPRDFRAELLAAEATHFAKVGAKGVQRPSDEPVPPKRALEDAQPDAEDEDPEAKRRRILADTRDLDADSVNSESDSSDEDSEDEDEMAELMRELDKIKRERAEQKAKEDAAKAAQEQEEREEHIALGNPLLNPKAFNVKRRWDDDVVFKNQARGTEQKGSKEFVNVRRQPPSVDWSRLTVIGPSPLRLPQEVYGMYLRRFEILPRANITSPNTYADTAQSY
jgi:protein CWC15